MLRLKAHSLIRTADPQTERPDPRQLAYVAGLHGEPVLRAQAEQFSWYRCKIRSRRVKA
jgi:hypothetical protein